MSFKIEEINKKEFNKWIRALRSGSYEQTKYVLQNCNGYCCLGVACEVLIPDSKKKLTENGLLAGAGLVRQPGCPQWLWRLDSYLHDYFKIEIANLNDNADFTFDEIADILEAIVVHKVLE